MIEPQLQLQKFISSRQKPAFVNIIAKSLWEYASFSELSKSENSEPKVPYSRRVFYTHPLKSAIVGELWSKTSMMVGSLSQVGSGL